MSLAEEWEASQKNRKPAQNRDKLPRTGETSPRKSKMSRVEKGKASHNLEKRKRKSGKPLNLNLEDRGCIALRLRVEDWKTLRKIRVRSLSRGGSLTEEKS